MKTAIYCRVANVNDNAIAAQENQMLHFAKQNGCGDCVCYRDNGVKGLTLNRPGFNALMAAVEVGEVGCVIVKDISRVCRSFAELAKWLKSMEDKGIRLIAVNDAYDSLRTLESGQFREMLALIQAEMKRELSEKTKAGIAHSKKRKSACAV